MASISRQVTRFFSAWALYAASLVAVTSMFGSVTIVPPAGAVMVGVEDGVAAVAEGAVASAVASTENGELHSYKLLLAGLAAVAFVAIRRRRI